MLYFYQGFCIAKGAGFPQLLRRDVCYSKVTYMLSCVTALSYASNMASDIMSLVAELIG